MSAPQHKKAHTQNLRHGHPYRRFAFAKRSGRSRIMFLVIFTNYPSIPAAHQTTLIQNTHGVYPDILSNRILTVLQPSLAV